MSATRIRNNFKLGTLLLFGVIALVAILPFAIYRFASGNLLAGWLDAGILACIAAGVVYAWRGGDLDRAGLAVVLTSTAGCLAIAVVFRLPGLLWMYPILLANFLMVDRWKAFAIAAVALAFIGFKDGIFASLQEELMFLMSAGVTIVFSLVFASRTESQRLRLESLASHDRLTGAKNRLAMEQSLAHATHSRREGDPRVGIAILDLDHFKGVNDRHGHEAGDRVLADFVALVRRVIRSSDSLFRYGGEEFVLLLPGVDAAGLQRVTETLRAAVESELAYGASNVTVSAGTAMLQPGEEWPAWLGRADAALYRAKRAGRNRVEIAGRGGAATAAPEPTAV